ncbi:MAG: class I mannose-6-phosphate isomerase [Planctomycetota bacterium]|nr:class I mannose-6-phosphate isomerase [Planctomycetota bacterium]
MNEPRLTAPLCFQPILMERVWGGDRISALFGRHSKPGKAIGESWELVDRTEAQSVLADGAASGRTLHELVNLYSRPILGELPMTHRPFRFPLLVKYIDARTSLSVQVHPGDTVARGFNDRGKSECWVVVHAQPGAKIVRGLKPGISRGECARAVEDERVEEVLHSFTPHVGDVIALPPGMVHALGAGLVVAEIQQNSDLTFRLYDYKRPGLEGKPRQLHVAEALAVMRFGAPGDEFSGDMSRDTVVPLSARQGAGVVTEHLLQGRYFDLHRYLLAPGAEMTVAACPAAPRVLMAIAGSGRLGEAPLKAGQTVLLPAALPLLRAAADKSSPGPLVLLASRPMPDAC